MTDARQVRDEVFTHLQGDATFTDFDFIKFPPRRRGYSPPTIFFVMDTEPATTYGFGSLRIDDASIHIDLMFREGFVRTIDGDVLTDEDLAQAYLDKMLDRVKTFRPTNFEMDSLRVSGATHEENIGQMYLYGAGIDISIGYKV